jgi:hypothetical protein
MSNDGASPHIMKHGQPHSTFSIRHIMRRSLPPPLSLSLSHSLFPSLSPFLSSVSLSVFVSDMRAQSNDQGITWQRRRAWAWHMNAGAHARAHTHTHTHTHKHMSTPWHSYT